MSEQTGDTGPVRSGPTMATTARPRERMAGRTPPGVPTSRVTIDGHELSVRRAGSGRPVLLLHGIPTSASLWRHVQPPLATRADTIAVDLLGYGDSAKPSSPEPSLPVQVRLVEQLLVRWDLRDVLVVGHDIGGGVAQLLALAAPDRVSALVLIDSIAYDSFPEPTIARLTDPSWDERILHVDLSAGLRRSLAKGLSAPDETLADLAQLYAAPFEGARGRAAYLRAARALHTADLAEAMPAVEELPIPVRLIWGEDDVFQPVHYGRRLARALPRAELVVIPGARHFLPEDRPSQLAGLLLAALGETGHE